MLVTMNLLFSSKAIPPVQVPLEHVWSRLGVVQVVLVMSAVAATNNLSSSPINATVPLYHATGIS